MNETFKYEDLYAYEDDTEDFPNNEEYIEHQVALEKVDELQQLISDLRDRQKEALKDMRELPEWERDAEMMLTRLKKIREFEQQVRGSVPPGSGRFYEKTDDGDFVEVTV